MRLLMLMLAAGLCRPLAARPAPTPQRTTVGDWIRGEQADESASAQVQARTGTVTSLSPAAAAAPMGDPAPAATPAPLFEPGLTEAAYQVDEHIYGHENHVVGLNKGVTVALEAQGGLRRVVVTAPNNQFKTDSPMRDGRVAAHLGGANHAVTVSSAWFPAADLAKLESGANRLPGVVTVRENSAPVTLTAQGDGAMVRVDVATSFNAIGLAPPSLGPFGMLGEVHQPLTLSAQIQLKQVSGLQ
ncbi:MAG TPA: hypothetical protein VK842_08565 [bacterium]|nr:hypothetical protein [bacterium]